MSPVVRRILVAVALAIGIVILAVVGAFTLVLGTTTGARWALSWASGAMPAGSLTVREVRGSLMSPLELRGVTYRTDSLSVSVGRLAARWDLSNLHRRELDVRVLHVDSVRVRRLAPSPPPDTTRGLALPEIRLPIALRVGELRLRDLVYVPYGDSTGFALDEAVAAGEFRGDLLRITSLRARNRVFDVDLHGYVRPRREYPLDVTLGWTLRLPEMPEIRGQGQVAGSVHRARLNLRLTAPCRASAEAELSQLLGVPSVDGRVEFSRLDPHRLVAGIPGMDLSGRIVARGTIARFQARATLSMRSDSIGAADASGALARQGDSLRVDSLIVTIPGQPGRLSVRGLITGLTAEPRADLAADWRRLAWSVRGDTLVHSDEGHLRFLGTAGRYMFRFEGGLATAREDLGRWQVEAAGDTTHLEVASLEGMLLGGAVLGHGTVAWKPRLSWSATVRGDSLDPGRRLPEWPGRLALELETQGEMRDTVPELEVHITRLDGTLRRLPFAGRGAFAISGRSWSARDLRLSWGEARLAADGTAGADWDLGASLAVPNLGTLLKGSSGALRADLRLSGSREEPHLKLEARGDSLATGQLRAGALTVTMDAGPRESDTLLIDVGAREASLGGRPLEALTLRGEGRTGRHALAASVRMAGDTLALAASGGFTLQRWLGSLDRLEIRTGSAGVWQLAAPVEITASAREARVDSFCVGSGASSICGSGGWSDGGALHASAQLSAVPTGLFDAWLPAGAHLIGTLDGSIDASAKRPEGPLTATARLSQGPAVFTYSITPVQRDTVQLGEGRLSFDSDEHGARGALAVRWEGGDTLDVRVSLPGFNVLRPDTANQAIEGTIRSRASDLAVLGAYVPGLDHTRGRLSADLDLGGTLLRPEADGEISLREGSASIPALGLALQDIDLVVRCAPARRITLEGSVRSGKGRVAITGVAELGRLGLPTITLGLKGKDFTAADTREAKVTASPDLQIRLQRSRVDLTGQLDIPFARLVSLSAPAQLPAPPSPDVVYAGQETDSSRSGPRIYSRVRIVIGDDVEVRVPRFRGRPEGSILAVDEPGQATLATGELKVSEGFYRAYGQDLRIERGRLIFGGGPISNPGLDLRASRTASDGTVAGVQITGTAESPVLAIFSTPAMSQSSALSYIMFGKPLSDNGDNAGAASLAAAQLSVQGTDLLARGVAGKLGIQDASVESKEGSLQEASLFLGTYLSPKLYVSYGIGLFEPETTIRVRYKMSSHWSLETESGSAPSGLLKYTRER